jgi:hypothetical protein
MTEQTQPASAASVASNSARHQDYRSYYANLTRLRVTSVDLTLIFARAGIEVRPGELGSVDVAEVVLPPSQVKVLAQALTVVAETYEETWGPIAQVPRDVDFTSLREMVRGTKPAETGG